MNEQQKPWGAGAARARPSRRAFLGASAAAIGLPTIVPSSALGLVSLTAVPLFLVWQWQLPDLAWVAWLSLAQIAWLAGRSTLATFRELRTRKVDGVSTF